MRILILTDSLGLPRFKPERVTYDEIWPVLIRDNKFQIETFSVGGWSSFDFLTYIKYYSAFKPDILIIQVGIVDCAPRFVTKKEKFFIENLPLVGKRLLGYANKKWIRKIRNITYVNPQEFKNNIDLIIRAFPSLQNTFLIEIVGSKEYEHILPGVNFNISKYNEILKSIPNSSFIQYKKNNILMSDHHHINAHGHILLSKKIKEKLNIEKNKLEQ